MIPACYFQENIYTLLGKVAEAKKSYIKEGNIHPTTVDRLEILLFLQELQFRWSDLCGQTRIQLFR
jgi:hypothetical protein